MSPARRSADRLSAHDMLYLASASASLPLSAAALFVVGPDADGARLTVDRLRAHIDDRLHLLPRFRQVVRPLPIGLEAPRWVDDPDFELERHVRLHTLPELGGHLEELVGRLNQQALDTRLPLWEVHVLDGIADDATAFLIRWHHAMVDGMSAMRVIRTLLDLGPEPVAVPSEPPGEETGERPAAARSRSRLDAAQLEGWLALLKAAAGRPRFTPGTGRARWGAAVFPERELRAAARSHGVSLDEVVAALSAGAIAYVLSARGDERPGDSVRTLVPIFRPGATRMRGLGNHGAHFVTRLPVAPMAEGERVRLVAEAMREGRSSNQVEAIARGIERLEGAPPPVIMLLARMAGVTGAGEAGAIDLIVTFIPGPRRRLWLAGHPLERALPVIPIGPRARLTIGALSLGGVVGIGVSAGTDVIPELDLFVRGLRRTAQQLGIPDRG